MVRDCKNNKYIYHLTSFELPPYPCISAYNLYCTVFSSFSQQYLRQKYNILIYKDGITTQDERMLIMDSIGSNIKLARKRAGLTQIELAKLTSLSRSYIGDIENNRYNPSLSTLRIIAGATHQPINNLIGSNHIDTPASTSLPPLTSKDEREISKDLENMIEALSGAAAMGDSDDEEDLEMLKASLKQAMMLSKRIAKKKFTPKKYRKDEPTADTAALIGKKILTASTDAQLAVSAIIEQDKKK